MTPQLNQSSDLQLLDALTTGVVCLDDGFRVHYINSAAEQVLGVSARQSLGQRLTRLITLPDSLFTRMREAQKKGQPYTDREIVIGTPSGESNTVDCSISPHHLTELRQGLLLELVAVDRPMRIARDEAMLTQQEHAQSLLRGLAHEIKNPLGGLRGAAQLLERQLLDEELTEYTSIIIREADRLQDLIDRMLGPASRPQRLPVNVHEVLQHVRRLVTPGASDDVVITADYDPSIPEFLNDRNRLVQVLLNIVGNAIEAVGESGSITLRTRVLSRHTIGSQRHALVTAVSVIDDGPGVPDHLIDQIFYPMVTGTDTGTGLGLSIAQSIMNQLGGLIEVTSTPGKTNFTVLIPLEPADG
jgi:two-component system nitrogen regulation sensor histidine kinase GlnL